jgi:hypothetical protein
LTFLALIAYTALVLNAAGLFRAPRPKGAEGSVGRFDVRSAVAWAAALVSTFALPWGGIPISHSAGLGSWLWFLSCSISLALIRPDGSESGFSARCVAFFNVFAIMGAIYAFMLKAGVPGDILSIEGPAVITGLGGIANVRLICSYALLFASAVISYAPVHSSPRTPALLSFSYSSFLAMIFIPPAHLFFESVRPQTAIVLDAACYFLEAGLICLCVLEGVSSRKAKWKYFHAACVACLTSLGVYLLFASLGG